MCPWTRELLADMCVCMSLCAGLSQQPPTGVCLGLSVVGLQNVTANIIVLLMYNCSCSTTKCLMGLHV
jgi:hypothetical protein